MDSWISQANRLTGKRPATDDMEIAVQAVVELGKQLSDLKSWVRHLEQEINELKQRRRSA